MARLLLMEGEDKSSHEIAGSMFRIGRAPDNDLVLNNGKVSRYHAEIVRDDGHYHIRDTESLNGIYVNNLKTSGDRLAHGDQILIGDALLVFYDPPEKAQPSWTGGSPSPISPGERIEARADDGQNLEVEVLLALDDFSSAGDVKLSDLAGFSQGRKLVILYRVASMLNSNRPFAELLEEILKLIFEVVEADQGAVFISNAAGDLEVVITRTLDGSDPVNLKMLAAIARRSIGGNSSIVCSDGCQAPDGDPAVVAEGSRSAICVPLWTEEKILGAVCLQSLNDPGAFGEDDLDMLTAVANHLALAVKREGMQEHIQEAKLLRANLERFHSPDVAAHIMEHSRGDERFYGLVKEREVSILFADISDFTSLIERLDSQEAVALINEYFDLMTGIIFKYKGTVDKFIGDAIMAIFGAPISHGNDAELALFSALEMMKAMETFQAGRAERQKFDIRIGINTGVVLSGYMGSMQRIEYTVLGDPVNVAARLQHIAEPKTILVGEDTYSHVKGMFEFIDRGITNLKGKKRKTRYYEVKF